MTEKFICIHGHFYQPPRENPWLEEVEFEYSAQPYHDWNARVTNECYAPNSASRIMDPEGRIVGLVSNYSRMSFNFGPTLLNWIASHKPELYESILSADKESVTAFGGHGSAMAQVYNHMIMPLANRLDKETQVKWGVRDFEKRFGRLPEGMWLPETAVDSETLEVLAENGVKFTILAPQQAGRVRKLDDQVWGDVRGATIDPRRAYICKLPSGKAINVFFFEKNVVSGAAFGDLLSNGENFALRLADAFQSSDGWPAAIVSIASDGEIYGHHHPHGDMALAYCIYQIQSKNLAKITNYAEYLERHPAEFEVEILENTSWSCAHGVERWRNDCGDNTGKFGWRQQWRKPLRDAMNWLRDELAPRFEAEAAKYLKDAWTARNAYIDVVLDRSRANVDHFLSEHASRPLEESEKNCVLRLLEMQRHLMLRFTSCGWFFDEISGLETVQVMKYAARALQLAQQVFGVDLEPQYVQILAQAPSNILEFKNGAEIYARFVKRAIANLSRIAAQNTIQKLFDAETATASENTQKYGCCFTITNLRLTKRDAGKFRFVASLSEVQSSFTLDKATFACAAIWLGDHNVTCGVRADADNSIYEKIANEMNEQFEKGQINEAILLIPKHFGTENYSLKDVFRDDQIFILNSLVKDAVEKATELNKVIYRDNSALLKFMKEVGVLPPESFRQAAAIVLNSEIRKRLTMERVNAEELRELIGESKFLAVDLESERIALEAIERIAKDIDRLRDEAESAASVEELSSLIVTLRLLPTPLNLWQAQNAAFRIAQTRYKLIKEKKDPESVAWVSAFGKLCSSIGVKLD